MKAHLGFLMRISALMVLMFCGAHAQEFEVASIKPAAPTTGHFQYHMTMKIDAGRVSLSNASMVDLVKTAYRVKAFEVSGPDWMPSQKFDVVAKLPEGVSADRIPEMLQTLLTARFKLAIHRATKEGTGFALVAVKGGPKLKESPAEDTRTGWKRTMGPEGTMHIDAIKMTMPALADLVASFLDYPVRDMTDIKGVYDLALDFSPEDLRNGSKTAGVMTAVDFVPGADSSGSLVYASLQKLGLKLDRRKLPIEVIVVDHVEKSPTEN